MVMHHPAEGRARRLYVLGIIEEGRYLRHQRWSYEGEKTLVGWVGMALEYRREYYADAPR